MDKVSLNPDEVLVVTLGKRAKSLSATSRKATKDPIKTPSATKKVGRRRIGSSGVIEFYDLGQVQSGPSWITRSWNIIPDITNTALAQVRDLNSSDISSFNTEFLSILVDSLETTARKLSLLRGHYFSPKIYFDSEEIILSPTESRWTADGLAVDGSLLSASQIVFQGAGTIEALRRGSFPQVIILKGAGVNKVTNSPSYGASAVTYTPASGDKWFLVPKLAKSGMIVTQGDLFGSGGHLFQVAPRYPDDPSKIIGFDSPTSSPTLDLDDFNEAFDHFGTLANQRYFTGDASISTDYSLTSFSAMSAIRDTLTDVLTGEAIVFGDISDVLLVGTLLMIIKQGSTTYYVWKN